MAIPTFDLIDVIRTIQKQRRFILIIVVLSLALAAVFLVVKKKKYKAESRFLVTNPLYSDRSNIFRSRDTRFVDYFGGDDDLDKVTALASSDTVIDRIIWNADLSTIYKKDAHDPKEHAALMDIFKKNFNIKRSEYKDIEVSYIAYDAQTAANVTNNCVDVLEKTYRHYYEGIRNSIAVSINDKIKQMDVSIDSLTDSLSSLHDRVGSTIRSSGEGGKGIGRLNDQVENLEAIKKELLSDKVHYISTLNEFDASTNTAMSLLKVITRATAPTSPTGPGMALILAIAGVLGFLFSVIWVLLMAYYRRLNEVIR